MTMDLERGTSRQWVMGRDGVKRWADNDQPVDETRCVWAEDEDGVWDTGCDNRFEFNEGTPHENKFEFCPYCGNRMKVSRYVQRTLAEKVPNA